MNRCHWPNLESNPLYIQYHDHEWGVPSFDDRYLFEMLVLESFQAGLSWLIILKKREQFRQAFDQFDVQKVAKYDEEKINQLMENASIVRNQAKIRAAINNANAFIEVQKSAGSFAQYIWSFTNHKPLLHESDTPLATNSLSDKVSKDLKKKGFRFMGSVTTYSFLEAIGVMNNHATYCFRHIPEPNK